MIEANSASSSANEVSQDLRSLQPSANLPRRLNPAAVG